MDDVRQGTIWVETMYRLWFETSEVEFDYDYFGPL